MMILSFRNMLEDARKSSYFYSEAETNVWRHTGDAFFDASKTMRE
jgi:hypothetical protein